MSVHYKLTTEAAPCRLGLVSSQVGEGGKRNLWVFPDGTNDGNQFRTGPFWAHGIQHGQAPGEWHEDWECNALAAQVDELRENLADAHQHAQELVKLFNREFNENPLNADAVVEAEEAGKPLTQAQKVKLWDEAAARRKEREDAERPTELGSADADQPAAEADGAG